MSDLGGTFKIGGDLEVHRLGYGAMRITGDGIWGQPPSRDEAKAVLSPANPCYMNIIDPVIVGFGEGTYADASSIAADVFDAVPGLGGAAECLAPPIDEPAYPPDGLRP